MIVHTINNIYIHVFAKQTERVMPVGESSAMIPGTSNHSLTYNGTGQILRPDRTINVSGETAVADRSSETNNFFPRLSTL